MVGRLFSRFREPKAQFDVEVVSGDLFPGSTVEIRTTFQPQEQFQVREAVIGLVCTEKSWKWRSGTKKGVTDLDLLLGEVRHSTELVKMTESLLDSSELIPGTDYRKYVEFTIPENSPPTAQGDVVDISWRLFAYVVPDKRAQISRHQDIRVLSSPDGDDGMREAVPVALEAHFDRCELGMNVDSRLAEIGGILTGNFRLTSSQDTRLFWVTVELVCTERAGLKEKFPKDFIRFIFDMNRQFQANEVKEWPFEIRLPRNALASVSQSETEVRWELRAGATPRMRSRMTVSTPIRVFSVPPAQIELN